MGEFELDLILQLPVDECTTGDLRIRIHTLESVKEFETMFQKPELWISTIAAIPPVLNELKKHGFNYQFKLKRVRSGISSYIAYLLNQLAIRLALKMFALDPQKYRNRYLAQ